MIQYFVNYDRRMVGLLDSLFNKWADSKGISKECRLIATYFNTAIDSAKTGICDVTEYCVSFRLLETDCLTGTLIHPLQMTE